MPVVVRWNRNGKENKTEIIIMPVYKTVVFPCGEYCMHFCTAQVKRNLAEMKRVQGGQKGDQKYGASSIRGTTEYTRTIQCEKEIT